MFDDKNNNIDDINTNDKSSNVGQELLVNKFLTLPLRDLVIFPETNNAVLVGRANSIATVEYAKSHDLPILVATQIDPESDNFVADNLYKTATLCRIVDSIRTNEGNIKAIIYGLKKVKISQTMIDDNILYSIGEEIIEPEIDKNIALLGLMKACNKAFGEFCDIDKKIGKDRLLMANKTDSPSFLSYLMAASINFNIKQKQEILTIINTKSRLEKILEILEVQISIHKTEEKITKSIQDKISKNQKQIYLNERIKEIKDELGQGEKDEIEEIKKKITTAKMPKEALDKANYELNKLEKMNPYSSESGIVRSYLEILLSLPWDQKTKINTNLDKAKEILDSHHYGLDKVKERIIEFIAVQIRSKKSKGPILCLVGAPGVGKTSLAKSIAEALGRKYIKIALGGLRDEAEIRGHRRTYIGSMPGKIIQSMKKVNVTNPLILLDEIDKMSFDFRGDPSSALLEVLDPEQNNIFSDHYLEIGYDLSNVMFVATANSISSIPVPLLDRMEIIKLSGYTESEKMSIAKNYLINRQIEENGLKLQELKIDDKAILKIIRCYTFEAGVRNLNRELANIARKATKNIVTKQFKSLTIKEKNLADYAGPAKYSFGIIKQNDEIGVTTGLAYTEYGGDLLDIEALKFEGSGKIQITGKLGEVMKESAQAALSYARSIGSELKIDSKKFKNFDFHIHVPEGATPKDGPSAGVALCISLVSVLTNNKVRKDVAMTGEITLSGRVLPIGGLKEKLLAASRGGIKTVLIPEKNKKDLIDIPKEVTDKIKIMPISHIKQAIEECLLK